MCGIAGIVDPSSFCRDVTYERLRKVTQVQHHRGPDACGIYLDDKVGFAHNRLSIIDLSDAGKQPMCSRSGRCVIAYNGEVYNFRELAVKYRLELRSRSDTEVILEAFEKIGPAIFSELNGMFAFAIHDLINNAVWLARDRLGVKPLYISKQGQGIAFSSEIKGLFALLPTLQKRMRIDALHEWTYFGNALGSRTMFDGIEQLKPGRRLRIDLETGAIEEQAYWSMDGALDQISRCERITDPRLAAERTRELLGASVKRQLISDVPVGIFLSGGLDSSSIACLASRQSQQRLTTYSAAFDYDKENSELSLAAEVARFCGSDHREIHIDGGKSAEVVQKMIESHDQPFSDAANIPLYLMSKSIGPTHKVVLQGDAGDEMFAGYQRHLTLLKYGRYRGLFRALSFLSNLPIRNRSYHRVARILAALGAEDDAKAMGLFLTVERERDMPTRVFDGTLRRKMLLDDPFQRYRDVEKSFKGRPIVEKMLLADKSIILPDIFFQKVDRSTMAASVEVRVPFADNDLLDHVLSLSPNMLMQGGRQKGLLRSAMRQILPSSVLQGRKRGFGVPFGYWVTGTFGDAFRSATHDVHRSAPGLLDLAHIESLWKDHKSGIADHGFLFWKIFNLALWVKTYNVSL